MKNKRLEHLLNCYLAKTISSTEESELFSLLATDENDDQVKNYMRHIWEKANSGAQLDNARSEKILSFILKDEEAKVVSLYKKLLRRSSLAAASVILVIIISGLYFLSKEKVFLQRDTAQNQSPAAYKNDVLPGTTGAVLKLADGTVIVLDSATNGTLSRQGNTTIIKNGASVNYVQGNGVDKRSSDFNTIETARGKQFSLVLEDGTKVWLNAASSIHFPVVFDDAERRVDITGEAYFEVAKNKNRPFRVAVNGTVVEVLGTHFNINSYSDEASVNTTLLEGAVKISNANQTVLLSPGQQAQVTQQGNIKKLLSVNTSEVVAWKDNNFSFNNTDLKMLMRQLSRWYDVEVIYKDENGEQVRFNGDISRSVSLSNVLRMLELTGEVNFTIEGKKITIANSGQF